MYIHVYIRVYVCHVPALCILCFFLPHCLQNTLRKIFRDFKRLFKIDKADFSRVLLVEETPKRVKSGHSWVDFHGAGVQDKVSTFLCNIVF